MWYKAVLNANVEPLPHLSVAGSSGNRSTIQQRLTIHTVRRCRAAFGGKLSGTTFVANKPLEKEYTFRLVKAQATSVFSCKGVPAMAVRKLRSTPPASPTKEEKPCSLNACSRAVHNVSGNCRWREPANTIARRGTEKRNCFCSASAFAFCVFETGTVKVTIRYTSIG